MSSLISSFFIDPVVRQARRFSGAVSPAEGGDSDGRSLSHASSSSAPPPASATTSMSTPTPAAPTTSHVSPPAAPLSGQDLGVYAADGRPAALVNRIRQLSPLIRRPQSAVLVDDDDEGEDAHDDGLHAPSQPIDIPAEATGMSANPNLTLHSQFRQLHHDSPLSSTPATPPVLTPSSAQLGAAGHNAPAMSESLPADDGMRHLRARIHQIRDLVLSDVERAHMMHTLMTERYNCLRPQSPSSFISNDRPFTPTSGQSIFSEVHPSSPISTHTEVDPDNPFNLRPGDTTPTYRTRPLEHSTDNHGEEEDVDTAEDGSSFGCQHYKRNVKVQCFQCRRWYTCRHCHDAVEDHNLNRRKTENMLCMACGTPQKAAEECAKCEMRAAYYYCDLCKLWDDNSSKKIYHCLDCGICRRGEGLGKDYIHCKRCNVCISISHAKSHKCLERATDCDCPICGEYLFNSSSAVVAMPCGHYLHKGCYKLYMETAYKCPMCKKSAVNMELQWQKLTQAIESQPMPEQFADTRVIVQCNDCSAKSSVKYHWLGNKCNTCDSYNTNELRVLNGPESEEAANAILEADASSGARSPASVSSPTSPPLRSPRYYFTPDQPEETWLPGQLPSFPFQMPQFPGMPQMPQMPQFPGMPQLPPLPVLPILPPLPPFPQMPDPYELMERVSRSFSPFRNYLNPTGEIPEENVPIIDLDDERPECRATDGSTVRQPSLPQYVLERFSRSLSNYLNNPPMDDIPRLDLSESQDMDGLRLWGKDSERVRRSQSDDEDEDDDDESSSDESVDDRDYDDEVDAEGDENEFDLPGHR